MEFRHILYEKRADGVAVLTLNRPERLNALHAEVLLEIDAALDDIESSGQVRCFLLCGAPRPDGRPCFCAGFDLKSVAEGVPADPSIGLRVAQRLDDLLVPSIAVVDGVCSTGGAEIAVACDLRVVGEGAQIGDWHLKNLGTGLGGWGAATRWQRLKYIVIPHLMPLIIFVAMIHLMDSYRVFEEIVGFSSQGYVISLQWLTFDYLTPDQAGNRSISRASANSMLTMIGVVILLILPLRRTWRDHKGGH